MAVRPSRVDSGTTEIDALNNIRLTRNWSYQQLADDMKRLGYPVHMKTLQTLIAYRPKPYDRTLYQIRGYLGLVTRPTTQKASAAR